MIEFKGVSKAYADSFALNDLNLTIPDHALFVLVGPSGSGKTTTLKMINRLIQPTSGEILFEGQAIEQLDVRQLRLKMGYVLQNIALFPNLTIEENISIQLEELKWSKEKRRKTAQRLLEKVGLPAAEYSQRYPSELSGGEQQRVGIIRALAASPQVILMDEPFSALDPISRQQLQDLLLKIHQEFETTIVFVTHDMQEALRLGDQIAVMRDGHIQQIGTSEEILNQPANEFVETFFETAQNKAVSITLNDILTAGFGTVQTDNSPELPHLAVTDSLAVLAETLKTQPQVAVQRDSKTWTLNQAQLLDFLADQGGED